MLFQRPMLIFNNAVDKMATKKSKQQWEMKTKNIKKMFAIFFLS